MAQDPPKCDASGTVVNSITGEPVLRAMVSLGAEVSAGAATDDKGRWTISGSICGEIHPSATHAGFFAGGYRASPNSANRDSKSGDRVSLAPGASAPDLKIALMPEGSITGRVQDPNGDAIGQAAVELLRLSIKNGRRSLSSVDWAKTDARGNFAFDALPPGRYLLCATSAAKTYPEGGGAPLIFSEECYPGPRASSLSLAQFVRGNELRVPLTLRAVEGNHVRGTVVGSRGAAPVEIQMALMPADPLRDRMADGTMNLLPFHGAVAGPNGAFDLADVLPGSYRLEAVVPARQSGAEPLFAETVVEAGGTDVDNIKLVLHPPGSVFGTVRSEAPAGKPSAPAPVDPAIASLSGFVFSPDAEWNTTHTAFTIPQIAIGQYQFVVSIDSPTQWIKSATLNGRDVMTQPLSVNGPTGPIEIVVSEEKSDIDLAITSADGSPLAGDVVLLPRVGHAIIIPSSPDGHAHRHGLPAGAYRAWAFEDASLIPWAEEDFQAQFDSAAQKLEVKAGETLAATLTRLATPEAYR